MVTTCHTDGPSGATVDTNYVVGPYILRMLGTQ